MSSGSLVLHQPPRGPQAPSLSPFALKLETYIRMANINYSNVFGLKRSPKGKFPWITYNGKPLGDTTMIINFLNDKYSVDLNKGLKSEERAVAHAFQKMAEENLFWTTALMRFKFLDKGWLAKAGLPKIGIFFISKAVNKQAEGQGMGRHSYDEVVHIMDQDLKSLSNFLGSKKFLMGDQPCLYDAGVFGQLAQIAYHGAGGKSPGQKMIREKYTNLWEYCERMRATFWPDWDDCTTRGGTKKAVN